MESLAGPGAGKERAAAVATGWKENKSELSKSGKASRVKKVPDFNRLHDKWQQKMEKVEQEREGGISLSPTYLE